MNYITGGVGNEQFPICVAKVVGKTTLFRSIDRQVGLAPG